MLELQLKTLFLRVNPTSNIISYEEVLPLLSTTKELYEELKPYLETGEITLYQHTLDSIVNRISKNLGVVDLENKKIGDRKIS